MHNLIKCFLALEIFNKRLKKGNPNPQQYLTLAVTFHDLQAGNKNHLSPQTHHVFKRGHKHTISKSELS